MVMEGIKGWTACNYYYLMVRYVAQWIASGILINLVYGIFESEKKAIGEEGRFSNDDIEIKILNLLAVALLGSASLGLIGAMSLWTSLKLCETNNVEGASKWATAWFYCQIGSCCLGWVFPPVGIPLSLEFLIMYTCCSVRVYREELKMEIADNRRPFRQLFNTNAANGGVIGGDIGGDIVGIRWTPLEGVY